MRLKRFKVRNYRSIKSTPLIPVGTNLTIIGPNNEGKSNLVRALTTGLELLEELADHSIVFGDVRRKRNYDTSRYSWSRDCPLDLQDKENTATEFRLEFDLDSSDQDEFRQVIGSNINNHLPITISVSRNLKPTFTVNKPGKGFAALTAKSSDIAAFIGDKLSINYIPAVRTADHSARSVERLVSSSLRTIERNDEYRAALQTIEDLQKPVLEELESRLRSSLKTFVPSINSVNLELRNNKRRIMNPVSIGIDDGRLTPLANKGDGIISLVGMALLSKIDSLSSEGISLILAIEEPESHLHPRAIHNIRSTLDGLSGEVQVIITTHSPALVNRVNLAGNIVVEGSKARVASSVSEIRDVLGVRVNDNLTNSRISIICEGDNDHKSLAKILTEIEPRLATAFETGEISFNSLGGGGNLSYSVNSIQNSICEPVCLLDDDKAGRDAFEAANMDGLLHENDVVFTTRLGKKESEFEDLICEKIVNKHVKDKYKADMSKIPASLKKKKFSTRAKAAFDTAGRAWNDKVKARLKAELNDYCATRGVDAIDPERVGPLNSLAELVVERLEL